MESATRPRTSSEAMAAMASEKAPCRHNPAKVWSKGWGEGGLESGTARWRARGTHRAKALMRLRPVREDNLQAEGVP